MKHAVAITVGLVLALGACAEKKPKPMFGPTDTSPDVAGNSAPSAYTASLNAAVAERLPLSD